MGQKTKLIYNLKFKDKNNILTKKNNNNSEIGEYKRKREKLKK